MFDLPADITATFADDSDIILQEFVRVEAAVIRARRETYASDAEAQLCDVPPYRGARDYLTTKGVDNEDDRDRWFENSAARFCRYEYLIAAVEGISDSHAEIYIGPWWGDSITALGLAYELVSRARFVGFWRVTSDVSKQLRLLGYRAEREIAICRIKGLELMEAFRDCAWAARAPADMEPIAKCSWLAKHLGMSEKTLQRYREARGVHRRRGGGGALLTVNECMSFLPDIALDKGLQKHQRDKAAQFIRRQCGRPFPNGQEQIDLWPILRRSTSTEESADLPSHQSSGFKPLRLNARHLMLAMLQVAEDDLSNAADLRPVSVIVKNNTGRRVAPSTIWRWVRKGLKGVRLQAVFVNSCWHTNDAAFSTFVRQQTEVMLNPTKDCSPQIDDAALVIARLL